jgi:ferredoxin
MKTFYFSATGNSLYVAKRIGGNLLSIAKLFCNVTTTFEDDAIGFVVPCYSFDVPVIIKDFIKNNNFRANYFFIIVNYGNSYGAAQAELEKCLVAKGLKVNYSESIKMIDNFLPLFSIESQLKKEKSKKIEEKLLKICSEIANRQEKAVKKVPVLTKIMLKMLKIINIDQRPTIDKFFRIGDACNSCGICAKVCCNKNIIINQKAEYQHNCLFCLSCIHNCPYNAIDVKYQRSKMRFRNQNINISELTILD